MIERSEIIIKEGKKMSEKSNPINSKLIFNPREQRTFMAEDVKHVLDQIDNILCIHIKIVDKLLEVNVSHNISDSDLSKILDTPL